MTAPPPPPPPKMHRPHGLPPVRGTTAKQMEQAERERLALLAGTKIVSYIGGLVFSYFFWRRLGAPKWAAVAFANFDMRLVAMAEKTDRR